MYVVVYQWCIWILLCVKHRKVDDKMHHKWFFFIDYNVMSHPYNVCLIGKWIINIAYFLIQGMQVVSPSQWCISISLCVKYRNDASSIKYITNVFFSFIKMWFDCFVCLCKWIIKTTYSIRTRKHVVLYLSEVY